MALPVGVTISECLRRIPSGDLGQSPTGERFCSEVGEAPSSFMNLTLHSEFLRDERAETSLPRLLAKELRRLGLETVIIGRFTVDGVGVGGLTYTSGTVDTG